MVLDTEKTVREIGIAHPGAVKVFESLGIDYCCGGKRSLGEAFATRMFLWMKRAFATQVWPTSLL
jgi:iron-sulfur cluster repair protein YtfE (RIC family)